MAKYLSQLRRGTKEEWIEYEKSDKYMKPLAGELVVEYDNGIPRLKIGDGITDYSKLPYMSVDSFILPKPATITMYAGAWQQEVDDNNKAVNDRYFQDVSVENATITPNSKVDLQPSPEQLVVFCEKDVTFTTVNDGGNIRVCAIGIKPTNDYTIQVTITEVAADG